MELNRKDNNIISCSSNHAIAIGVHGHVYAWGSSFSYYSEKASDQNESFSITKLEIFSEKLGFFDRTISKVSKPAFYSIRHPIYDVKATQVSCGENFTAIVVVQKSNIPEKSQKDDNIIFSKEIEDFLPENPLPSFQIPAEIYSKILIANKLRKEIDEYLKLNMLHFIDLFKSSTIKLESFINILKNIIKSKLSEEELIEFVNFKDMKLAGNYISLKSLYNLIYKCDQGKGLLYLMGLKSEILPYYGDKEQYFTMKHDTLCYHIINLPDTVSVAKVACGKHFVIVLSHSFKIFTFGSKNSPALGKNRSATHLQIKPLSELSSESTKIIDVSCGLSHCLALSTNGVVYAWGKGKYGKIGNGRHEDIFRPEAININNTDVIYIKAGHHSSFCKTVDGLCYAWGIVSDNRFNPISLISIEKPFNFVYDFDVADIAIGSKSCAYISQAGNLYASRPDDDSLLHLSQKYKNLEGLQFFQVSGQDSTFFAVSTRGSIFSWSSDPNSTILGRPGDFSIPIEILSCSQQFAVKDTENTDVNSKDIIFENSKQVVKVACTEENTILITDKGEGIGCGSNEFGQLCLIYGDIDEYSEDQDEITDFVIIPRLSRLFKMNVISMACGKAHILAINHELKVLSWGCNLNGQLGKGFFSKSEKNPEVIKSLKGFDIEAIAAGDTHSLVLTKTGEVWAFGSAENGKLGLGKVNASMQFSIPEKINGLKNIKKISCGENHSAAINHDYAILTWGYGWHGQLGYGLKDSLFEPTSILIQVEWKEVSCGATHTLGLSRQGTLYHWGEVNLPEEDPELVAPTKVKGLEEIKFKSIYASYKYSAGVIEHSTTVYMWGKQYYKRLISEKADIKDGEISKPLSQTVPYNERIKDFSINKYHGSLVTDQGKVYTWGYGYNGRIGNSSSLLNDQTMAYSHKPINLSKLLIQDENEGEPLKEDLQNLLQNETEISSQSNLREIDQQIMKKFIQCIELFIDISNQDSKQITFFSKCEHKQLTRLQQEPFKCQLIENNSWNPEITEKTPAWGALLTIFQVHCCYIANLLSLNLKDEKKLEMLGFIFCDLEGDNRMIYTGIYLGRLLLRKVLSKKNISFPEFVDDSDCNVYRELVYKLIVGSNEDMTLIRKIAADTIQQLGLTVHSDEFGIDQDPTHGILKSANIKITAYQLNKNIIDRRMSKLKQVLISFQELMHKFSREQSFSQIVYFIAKDFLVLTSEVFDINYENFENLNVNAINVINTVLKIIFEPLIKVFENPEKFYILTEISFNNPENNFRSLSEAVRKFFDGTELGLQGERWLSDLNTHLKSEKCQIIKRDLLINILNSECDLEEKYLESLFLHSLEPFNKEVTVNGSNLIFLQRLCEKNIDRLRVNNPSYDPLTIILRELGPISSNRIFGRGELINLTLLTRCLRQDQSIVRCTQCDMLIPRDMAPSNFKQVIDIFDPMPPNSSESILSNILATGPRKQKKGKILEYIKAYEENYITYLKDFSMCSNINTLILNADTVISAQLGLDIGEYKSFDAAALENDREKILLQVEEKCIVEYRRRIQHSLLQKKISNALDNLYYLMVGKVDDCLFDDNEQQNVLFNLEYGASNLELEKFSDSVMFSIYLNKVREYTNKKEMSLTLFENLTEEMKNKLRGFMKRTLNELVKKKIVTEFMLDPQYLPKNIVFSFEIDTGLLIIIATNSPKKLNICGRDEFREEELMFYEKISEDQLTEMREEIKRLNENELK